MMAMPRGWNRRSKLTWALQWQAGNAHSRSTLSVEPRTRLGGSVWLPVSSRPILWVVDRSPASDPAMDETEPTSVPASTTRDRLAEIIIRLVKGQAPLLAIAMLLASAPAILGVSFSIVRGEAVAIGVREIVALTLVLALAFLVLFALMVVLPALMEWSGFDAGFRDWAGCRRAEKAYWKRLLALGEAHRAPFHLDQPCKLSPAEEVWVRRARDPQSNQLSLEVLHTRDSGQTWERLSLRLEPVGKVQVHCVPGRMAGHPEDPPPFLGQGRHIVRGSRPVR